MEIDEDEDRKGEDRGLESSEVEDMHLASADHCKLQLCHTLSTLCHMFDILNCTGKIPFLKFAHFARRPLSLLFLFGKKLKRGQVHFQDCGRISSAKDFHLHSY